MGRPLALLVLVLAVAVAGTAAAAPPPLEESCVRLAERARAVSFRATDGTRLAGVLLGSGRKGVVLAHQLGGDLCQWLPFARVLAAAGFRALAFDFRGYRSSATVVPRDVRIDRDVAGAASEIRRRGATRVFLIGASMGGTAVLGAAPGIRPKVSGVVDLSGPASIAGVDAVAAVRRLRAPVLFAAARYDRGAEYTTRYLYDAAVARDKRLLITDGTQHGVDLVLVPKVRRVVLGFLRS